MGVSLGIERGERLLVVRSDVPLRTLGWALRGGGYGQTQTVAWVEVRNAELGIDVDPLVLLDARLRAAGLEGAVGLMTSAPLERFEHERHGGAEVIATVGMSNALRAGDPVARPRSVGTINVLAVVDEPLSDVALVEAVALCAEARSLAVREADVPSIVSGEPASGTGTDCIVVAAPATDGPRVAYAGKHTRVGADLGAAVHEACARGVATWKERAG